METASLTSVTFAAGSTLTSIGQGAFYDTPALTTFTIPTGVTTIGPSAFGESGVTSVTIPASVTTIGIYAFQNAASLASVTFSGSALTTIAEGTFQGASALTSVTIPAGVTSIGMFAFRDATELTSVTIPASVTSIGQYAFLDATKLASFAFLGNAPTISDNAFYGIASRTANVESGAIGFGTEWGQPFYGWNVVINAVLPNGTYSCTTGVITTDTENIYQITNDEVRMVSGVPACSGAVVIPEGVSKIGMWAFNGAQLSSITIPESLTVIGYQAFASATSLESVTFTGTSSLDNINEMAFFNTPALTNFTIPNGVRYVGDMGFYLTGLTSINIPASLLNIGNRSFEDTPLASFAVDANNQHYSSVNGVLFNKNQTTMIAYPRAKSGTTYTIPSGVTSIAFGAFKGVSSLTSVTIPTTVTSIDGYAFADATSLASIEIPASVTTIGTWAFNRTSALRSITFASGSALTEIGYGVFSESGLTSIAIPNSVTSIADYAFESARSLASIEIPVNVTTIGQAAFQRTSALTSVTFANGSALTTMAYGVFKESGITSISIPEGVTALPQDGFRDADSLTSVTLPSTLTTIGVGTFINMDSLSSITIPSSVTHIESFAFDSSSALTSVYFSGNAPATIGDGVFGGIGASPRAFMKTGATGFGAVGSNWNGLTVAIGDHKVTYNSKGGSAVRGDGFATINGSVTQPTAPTRNGHTFSGWSITDGGTTAVTFPYSPGVTTDITLYAIWTASNNETYAVTFDSNNGSEVSSDTFSSSDPIEEPTAPTRAGHTFVGWSATDGGTTAVDFPYSPGVTTDITLYAIWTVNSYTVNYNSNNGTALSSGTFTFGGSIAEPTAPTRAGHTFAGWSATDGGTAVTFPYSPGVASDVTLHAKWTSNPAPVVEAPASPAAPVVAAPVASTQKTPPPVIKTVNAKDGKNMASIVKKAKIKIPKGAKVAYKVANDSKKVCAVVKGNLRMRGKGTCNVTVSVKSGKGVATSQQIAIKN
jgi:uncharacterized repeat protein (TIGR02543 family)